ncbi:MAG: threonine synthase [Chloroflexi bacterium]|nr:threonine synthase [Chloroflexota bacterium]
MPRILGLRCRECGRISGQEPIHVCDYCFGPLEVEYDYDVVASEVSRDAITQGPRSIFRYRAFLPLDSDDVVDLGTGFTPLVHAKNLGRVLGLDRLYIKNDCVNPTYSFKDRPVAIAASKALEFNFDTLACASTGNLAGSVAAHAAKAGLRAFVFIPDDLEQGKIVGAAIYAPHIIAVRGNYDDVNRLSSEVADKYGWAFVNINIRPYYTEGSKTLGFEVAEQLGWQAPDHLVVPVGSGGLLCKTYKGLQEFARTGLIPAPTTRIYGAQPTGCSTVVRSLKGGSTEIVPVKPHTVAKSLAMGNPADGYYALRIIRDTCGAGEDASDEEIIAGMRLLAETEGIFAETAGGVTVAALKKLAQQGAFRRDETVVALITGNGLKTQEAVTGQLAPVIPVRASLQDFEARLATLPAAHPNSVAGEEQWSASASSSPILQSSSSNR